MVSSKRTITYIDVELDHDRTLVQDCENSIAKTLELLQFCTKPSIKYHHCVKRWE